MTTGDRPNNRAPSLIVFIVTVVPFGGIAFLNWSLPEALFVYWIEIGLFMFLYTGLILFAQREPQPEERSIDLATIPVPFVSGRSGSIRPIGWLPPIHYRNVRYAAGFLPFGLFFWFASAYLLLTHSDPDVRLERTGISVSLDQQLSVIADAYTPEALGLAILLFGVRLVAIRREFFGRQRYEHVSAPMVVETPFRIGAFWGLLIAGTTVSLPFVILPVFGGFGHATVTETWVVVIAVFGRITMELAALEARRANDPDGCLRWLTPEYPASDS